MKAGWLWVLVTPALALLHLALSRSGEVVGRQVLGDAFDGFVFTDRYSGYSCLPLQRRQMSWAHIKRDFTAIAERSCICAEIGQRLFELERQLFHQWHRWREGQISRQDLQAITTPIRQAIETRLKEVSHLGFAKGEKTPWASTVRTCCQILKMAPALWTFLDNPEVDPTNNAAGGEAFSAGVRALRPAVIQRKLSYCVQYQRGALCQSRLLTVTTTLKQQERDVMAFLLEAWDAHNNDQPAPSLLPQRD